MLYELARPFVFALDPEVAHELAFANLERAHALGLTRLLRQPPLPRPLSREGRGEMCA